MRPSAWMAISFGCTLAVVVGLRLNTAGLLFVATLLLGALLLCPVLAMRWAVAVGESSPEVRVERPPSYLSAIASRPRSLMAAPQRPHRRGGWPHLERIMECGFEDRADAERRESLLRF